MRATVPTAYISSGAGSSIDASCCVARKIVRSEASASSSARTEPGLPILKATFVKGNMTTSRIGTIGSRMMSAGVRSEYSSITQEDCHFKRDRKGREGRAAKYLASARPLQSRTNSKTFRTALPLGAEKRLKPGREGGFGLR